MVMPKGKLDKADFKQMVRYQEVYRAVAVRPGPEEWPCKALNVMPARKGEKLRMSHVAEGAVHHLLGASTGETFRYSSAWSSDKRLLANALNCIPECTPRLTS